MDLQDLHGLRVYQDMVLAGQTVVEGRRDCLGRWEMLSGHLPSAGSILDVGSNLGWFGLKMCERSADCVVASVEPDLRSAALQRHVLHSHGAERICLLTGRAGAGMAETFIRARQTFDAVLCLSVLHWLPDHRAFLSALGTIARCLLVEQPDPREQGAGFAEVRQQIGAIGPYLRRLFPDRPVECLGQLPSHRDCPFPREIWRVGQAPGPTEPPSPGLDVGALLALRPSWPPRSWWQAQWASLSRAALADRRSRCRLLLTSCGLVVHQCAADQPTLGQWRRRLRRLPEKHLLTPRTWIHRHARRLAGRALRGLRLLRCP